MVLLMQHHLQTKLAVLYTDAYLYKLKVQPCTHTVLAPVILCRPICKGEW